MALYQGENLIASTGNKSVLYTEQTLTDEQKAQARANIGVLSTEAVKPAGKSYLTFSSPNSFTLAVNDATKHWDGTLEYFASNKTWTAWDGTTTLSSVDNDGENVLYLRGTGNTKITGLGADGPSDTYRWVLTGSDIACVGNIENLLDYATVETGQHPTMVEACYSGMFFGCTALTQAPALPATTLADYCYFGMFYGCTSLTQAPALPATTLASNCYNQMFRGCTSLTKAPSLPATTLAESCYYSMFRGCTSLTQAPALPATTLAESCYAAMFQSCTSLKLSSSKTDEYTQEYRIPSSGSGTIASNALFSMFSSTGGTFTGTPDINTTYYLSSDNMVVRETEVATLREYVWSIAAPASHARDTDIHVTAEEKAKWNSKADAPFKPAGKSYLTFSSPNSFTLAVNDATKHWDGTLEYFASDRTWTVWDGTNTLSSVENYGEYVLYLRGTGNTVITGNSSNYKWVLTGTDISCIGNIENLLDYETVQSGVHPTMASYCYSGMFSGCTSLTQAPALPATTLSYYCYDSMFYGCTSLIQAPALPATTLTDYCYSNMFSDCTSLTQAPALPATTLAIDCYSYMFYNCTSLIQAPALPATTLSTNCYRNMFLGCTSLTQAPVLPAITLAEGCYTGMLCDCTSLTQAPTLPATTLATNCYQGMFSGCTSLTQAPALPATTLANYCYDSMFYGCTSLKLSSTQTDEYTQEYRIPSSGTGTIATDALTNMFASTGGTFTGTPDINTTYYLSSDNMVVRETEVATLREYVWSIAAPIASKPKITTVNLLASGWDSTALTQTVTVTGILADETKQLIQTMPAPASISAITSAGVYCSAQGENSLTFTCTAVPSEDIVFNISFQDANYI